MSRATLRPFHADDLDDVLAAWHAASLVAHPFLSEEFLAAERREIAERWLPIAETWVAEVDGSVVGFVAMLGNEVGAIFVDPERHGCGVGRALMDHVRLGRPFLELDVFEANPIGRRFYEAVGFRQIGTHVHEATGQRQLRLRLDG